MRTGNRIVYKEAWDASSGTLEYIEGPSGERTEYEYDDFGRPVEVRSSSLPDKKTLTYSLRLPASAGHNGGTYAFEYDDYCDVTALRSGNIVLTERARSRSPLQNTEEKTGVRRHRTQDDGCVRPRDKTGIPRSGRGVYRARGIHVRAGRRGQAAIRDRPHLRVSRNVHVFLRR